MPVYKNSSSIFFHVGKRDLFLSAFLCKENYKQVFSIAGRMVEVLILIKLTCFVLDCLILLRDHSCSCSNSQKLLYVFLRQVHLAATGLNRKA